MSVLASVWSPLAIPNIEAILENRRWQHIAVVNQADRRLIRDLSQMGLRLAARGAVLLKEKIDWEHPLQLGYAILPLWRTAKSLPTDLFSLHLEKSMWVGTKLLALGRPFRVDIEDWHSEDGLPEDRANRPIRLLKKCERKVLNGAVHASATSHAMADALAEHYGCPKPTVIYNSFPLEERSRIDGRLIDRPTRSGVSIIWFSQTIGPGRGLEALIAAFGRLPRYCQLHLRGKPREGYIETLLKGLNAEVRRRVYLHSLVPPAGLLSRLSEHDVGYCGELSDCKSRDVTITNKAFEYMRARLAIVASDTRGQLEMAAVQPEAISIFRQGDSDSLYNAIYPLVADSATLLKAREAALQAIESHFSWEQSKARLQAQVLNYFGDQPVSLT